MKIKIISLLLFGLTLLGLYPSGLLATTPTIVLTSPSTQTITLGAAIYVSGTATAPDGDILEHWLEVKRPAGDWSWGGWLTSEPWGPALGGNSYSSTKETLI